MKRRSTVLVFAGPNGSGKSTLIGDISPVGLYINADDIQKALGCSAEDAAKIAEDTREFCLEQGVDFTFETVLSTDRNLKLMKRAKELGYYVMCVYTLTVDPKINVRRVRQRVEAGGHDVPVEKIIVRYKRAMGFFPELCKVCSRLLVYDNSRERGEGGPDLIVEVVEGIKHIYPSTLWSQEAIHSLLAGNYQPCAS